MQRTPEGWTSDIFSETFLCVLSYTNKLLPTSPPTLLGLVFPQERGKANMLEENPGVSIFPTLRF